MGKQLVKAKIKKKNPIHQPNIKEIDTSNYFLLSPTAFFFLIQ